VRRVLAVVLSVAAWAPAPAAELGLEQLMQNLGRVQSSEGRFTESKHLSILEAPLESSGTLVYRAPGRLEKHTLTPEPETLILDNGQLVLESVKRGWRKSFSLREYPVIWAFVESIRSTLAGDLPMLQRFYTVELEGGVSGWQLRLRPREPEMQAVVDEVRISGSGTWINQIETLETGGNRAVMNIEREPL
jgi:hypothetical protein